MPEVLDADPRMLHLPPSRDAGADPAKLQRQIAKFGRRTDGMPLVLVYRGIDWQFENPRRRNAGDSSREAVAGNDG